jgi:hypothetical protein
VEVENVERLLAKACRELGAFALGWNERHLCNRIYDIWRFAFFNGNRVIPLARRRRIARLAADLRGVSGSLDGEFLEVLRDLAEAGRWCARELRKELDELGLGRQILQYSGATPTGAGWLAANRRTLVASLGRSED